MRRQIIIKPVAKNTINVDEINPHRQIIVFVLENRHKGILIQPEYNTGKYKIFTLNNSISVGNGWGTRCDDYSLKEALDYFTSVKVKWYALDTIEELAEFILTPIDKL